MPHHIWGQSEANSKTFSRVNGYYLIHFRTGAKKMAEFMLSGAEVCGTIVLIMLMFLVILAIRRLACKANADGTLRRDPNSNSLKPTRRHPWALILHCS